MNPLFDKEFLKQLDSHHNKEIFVKIVSLTFNEEPLEEIEGRVSTSGGSINIDGTSKMRRTCSFTIVADELNIHDYYWSLETKFKLYVGVKNIINNKYDDIIWFDQGVYLITSFSTNQTTNNYTISIQGKDKMALLNGEINGSINAISVDFGNEIIVNDDGTRTKTPYKIKDIIRNVVHSFAGEPYHNIIINDVDELGLELIEYRGTKPFYIPFEVASSEAKNFFFNENQEYYKDKEGTKPIKVSDEGFKFYTGNFLLSDAENMENVTKVYGKNPENVEQVIMKINTGDTVGYRITELTYPGELIGKVGDSITNAVLDKIVSMLGDFEYFYNLDGQFVFQRKRIYKEKSWNSIIAIEDEKFVSDAMLTSPVIYSFENPELISSFQNNPNIMNVKNDFSVWGVKKSNNVEIPIHLRFAIDEKPLFYRNFNGKEFVAEGYMNKEPNCDWREIIYQMYLDKQKNDFNPEDRDEYPYRLAANHREEGLYQDGKTGYEQYYTDIGSFWRELYDPEKKGILTIAPIGKENYAQWFADKEIFYFVRCTQEDSFDENETYYIKIISEQHAYEVRDGLKKQDFDKNPLNYFRKIIAKNEEDYSDGYVYYYIDTDIYNDKGWVKTVIDDPQSLRFWFDFISQDSELLYKYSARRIGTRTKTENSNDVKVIYYRETPNLIFKTKNDDDSEVAEMDGYISVQLPENMESVFSMSGKRLTTFEKLENLLYNHAYCVESVTVSSIPIYYLEPNTRVLIRDDISGINGEYIVSKITIPLSHTGNMSISATKAIDRIY